MTKIIDEDISRYADVESVIKDCVMAILCRHGRFYPNKNYGSIIAENELNSILAGARYAVRDIDGVVIKSGQMIDGSAELKIIVNDEERSVTVKIENI